MWELVLFLVADGPNPKPHNVTPSGIICPVSGPCVAAAFLHQENCAAFARAHGRRWRKETGADVVAVCAPVKSEAIG